MPGCDEGNGETTSKEQNEIDSQLVPEKRIMSRTLGQPWFMYGIFGNTHFVTLFDGQRCMVDARVHFYCPGLSSA